MLPGEPVTIGRDRANSLAFRDDRLGPFHCVLERDGDDFVLRDPGSASGTLLNGRPTRCQRLSRGDLIELGPVRIREQRPGIAASDVAAARARVPRPAPASRRDPRADARTGRPAIDRAETGANNGGAVHGGRQAIP